MSRCLAVLFAAFALVACNPAISVDDRDGGARDAGGSGGGGNGAIDAGAGGSGTGGGGSADAGGSGGGGNGATDAGSGTGGGGSADAGGSGGGSTDAGSHNGGGSTDAGSGSTDAGGGGGAPLAPGSACGCDSDCAGSAENPGVCIYGVCMQEAAAACASPGSSGECGAGSRCWNLSAGAPLCWPDCDAFSCGGSCDADGSCVPADAAGCDATCAEHCQASGGDGCPPNSTLDGGTCYCDPGYVVSEDGTACVHECEGDEQCTGGQVCVDFRCTEPPCTPGSCSAGFVCSGSGRCVIDVGSPPSGSAPSCASVPSWECVGNEATCGQLVTFDPRLGDGYWDYPLNGETDSNQYRSYARRDVMLLVKYAAARTACLGASWPVGNGGVLGLGDMSEANGAIPGTSIGSPGHPQGTHVDGHDMDIAYFQVDTADNTLRPVCEHVESNQDQYHCTSEPYLLDVWRTAAFIAELHESPQLRVIGVDGRVGPLIESAVDQLCASGWLVGNACTGGLQLAYETTDEGRGWYHFHHHHLHISLLDRNAAGLSAVAPRRGQEACLSQSCEVLSPSLDPRRWLYPTRKQR